MNRSILIPLLLLVVLLLILFWTCQKEKVEVAPSELENFLGVDSAAVNAIQVKKLGTRLEFEKRSDGWYLKEEDKVYKARPGAVDDIARMAHALQVGEVVSSNPDKQMLFQVDTLMGTLVEFYRDDDYLGGVMVGKAAQNYQETFVRKPSSDEVYLAKGSYSYMFSRPPSSFRDKTLLSLTVDEINAIEFSGRETDYTLLHQDTLWSVAPHEGELFVGDQGKIGGVVRQMSNLQFSEFVEDPDSLELDFDKPDLQVTIGLKDGTERRLLLVKEEGESRNWFVRADQTDEPYIMFDYLVNNLAKKADDLRPPEEE